MITIVCKIPNKLNVRLAAAVGARQISMSAFVREALEQKLKQRHRTTALSAYDLAKHLAGAVRGPKDLLTNPRYSKNFGA